MRHCKIVTLSALDERPPTTDGVKLERLSKSLIPVAKLSTVWDLELQRKL